MFDRDFAEMIRPRDIAWYGHNASWRYSLAAALPSLAHRVLVLNPDDMLAEPTRRVPGYMRNGRLLELPGWRLGAVSLRAAELAGLLRRFFDEPAADGGTSQPVAAPTRTSPAARAIYRRFVDTPDGQVHVRMTRPRAQRRPPLVCFHFSPVHGGQYEALMPELGDDRMVLALDTPGYGESFKPRRRPEVADLAASAVRTIEALGLAQVDVLGDHTGSKIAVDVARQRPALVRRIVMNTANAYTAAEIGLWQGRMGTIPAAEDGAHVVALWDRLMNLNRGKMTRPRVAHRFYQTMRAGPCMWWGPKASHYYALGDVLPQLDHEILIVASTDDSTIEPTRRTAPLLKRGRLVEFAGFGNAMIEYRAPEVAPTIRAFLDA
jgi:pimeloyl-ACP methyl ester carboxylesterase